MAQRKARGASLIGLFIDLHNECILNTPKKSWSLNPLNLLLPEKNSGPIQTANC